MLTSLSRSEIQLLTVNIDPPGLSLCGKFRKEGQSVNNSQLSKKNELLNLLSTNDLYDMIFQQ